MQYRGFLLLTGLLLFMFSSYAPAQQDGLVLLTPSSPIDVPQNAETLKKVRKAAKQGDASAQFKLGFAYVLGAGVSPSFKDAANWIRKAAEQSHVEAQLYLGFMYIRGNGVRQNLAEGMKWIRKAADQGNPAAQFQVGQAYFLGNGVPRNFVEGARWFRKAAEQGLVPAQYNLGVAHFQGSGVSKDPVEGMKWLSKAAEKGYIPAQLNLGVSYLEGNGTPRDFIEAAKWLRKASDQGDTSAQCYLGTLYAEGLGTEQDPVQAYMWLTLSIDQSTNRNSPVFKKATDMRESVAGKMTPQKKSAAEQLAKEWENGHATRLDNGTYLVGKGVTQPVALPNPMPSYTEEARRARVQGVILLKCIIHRDGTVGVPYIIRGLGYGLDQSAINTIEKYWRFRPGTFQGQPVDVMVDIEVVFRIH
jgi:TonB family protein